VKSELTPPEIALNPGGQGPSLLLSAVPAQKYLLGLVPTAADLPALCLLSPWRQRFLLFPFALLEGDKMPGLDPRHAERMRHRGRHQV